MGEVRRSAVELEISTRTLLLIAAAAGGAWVLSNFLSVKLVTQTSTPRCKRPPHRPLAGGGAHVVNNATTAATVAQQLTDGGASKSDRASSHLANATPVGGEGADGWTSVREVTTTNAKDLDGTELVDGDGTGVGVTPEPSASATSWQLPSWVPRPW